MQMNFRKSMAAMLTGMFLPAVARAHPGHAPTDFSAQVSAPFAGADHFVAFVALSAVLLIAFRLTMKARASSASESAE